MKLLSIVYLFYMFFSIYFLAFFFLLYYYNKKKVFEYPLLKKRPSVSFIIPAYNESKTITETIEHIFAIDYKNISQVIVVNDCSTDNTKEIVEKLQEKYPKIILVNNPKNLGNAGKSKNAGLKYATGDIIAFVDADSYPAKDSLKKMLGFFEDEKVGAVTCPILVREGNTFIEKMQGIEYRIIALTRKLLGYVDSIYVTPGPLALYRREAILEIEGFDGNNMTEDIEITWHLTSKGWKREMCLGTEVSTTAPDNVTAWYRQRRRWTLGGIQCISKYKKEIMKKGILGMFVLPFFIIQFFLGLLGLIVFFYVTVTTLISKYIFVKYSIPAGSPLLTMNDLFITPSFLDYLGIILFVVSFIFTIICLNIIKKISPKKTKILNLIFFTIFYMAVYPLITISAIYNYFKRNNKWR
jgi:poly-beta-1,6-N-acetyl-D-glucosamine synthase